jgi:hypothetical protein
MPQATSTGSALALGCSLQERPVQVQVVDADPGKVAAAPGVELGAQALADPADGRAADRRLLAEDLGQHRLHVAVRQPPHPAGDHQGLQGPGLLPAVAVALGRVSGAALVAVAAELLADELLDHALEGQPHRHAGHLLDDAQQLPASGEQLMDLGADGLGGDTHTTTGVGPPS